MLELFDFGDGALYMRDRLGSCGQVYRNVLHIMSPDSEAVTQFNLDLQPYCTAITWYSFSEI